MKQAKFALTAVAVLAVIGGALAFKANRQTHTFYSLGTLPNTTSKACIISVDLQRVPVPSGGVVTPYSSTFSNAPTTTCTTLVINNG